MSEDTTIAPEEELAFEPDAELEEGVRQEISQKLEELKDEFGASNVSELLIDAALDESIAAFILEAEERLRETAKSMKGKARFIMHREPNDDLYIIRNLMPKEWNSAWLQLLTGSREAYDKYADDVLQACMVYPSFDETDWDYEGDKMNAPLGLTKTRLAGTFLMAEIPDPTQPTSVSFTEGQLTDATKVAKRHKPSL